MSKDKGLLEVEGQIVECLPNQTFKVKIENGHIIIAYTGGKMRKNRIRLIQNDRVQCEISPYDLTKGRITYRL